MKDTVFEFLNTPLNSGDAIFERFATLPGAVVGKGPGPLQRYVYIPGTRKDRVVLVAHMDTVWDRAYDHPYAGESTVIWEDGNFRSTSSECGIGADCRAGCAMLWAFRDSGHSILVADGEEHGKHGVRYLRKTNKKLFRELNRHCYMIEFDWKGTDCALFNQVDNTKKFKRYIEQDLGFVDSKKGGGCDLQILCRRICGVNLGVGYHYWHSPKETLNLAEWEHTFRKVGAFLWQPQKRFPSRFFPPYIRFCKQKAYRVLQMLKLKK